MRQPTTEATGASLSPFPARPLSQDVLWLIGFGRVSANIRHRRQVATRHIPPRPNAYRRKLLAWEQYRATFHKERNGTEQETFRIPLLRKYHCKR